VRPGPIRCAGPSALLLLTLLSACSRPAGPEPAAPQSPGGAAPVALASPEEGRRRQPALNPRFRAAPAPGSLGSPTAEDAPAGAPAPAGWTSLQDAASELGLRFRRNSGATGRRHYCEPKGGGVAFVDLDGDGWEDAYLVDGGPLPGSPPEHARSNRFFHNLAGRGFEDRSATSGLAGSSYDMGVATGDFDGDGDPDLYVTGLRSSTLYRNLGEGRFEDVGDALGARVPGWGSTALFVDVDEDGWLDLYVVRYLDYDPGHNPPCFATGVHSYCGPRAFAPMADVVLLNRGGQGFRDASTELTGAPLVGPGLNVVAADFDGDGHLDLYVANDEAPNFFLQGLGGGRYEERGLLAGVAVGSSGRPEAGMGLDVGDLEGDGRLDLVVGNFSGQAVNDFRNQGEGLFLESGVASGVHAATFLPLNFGVRLFDADNDADLDLFVCNGHVWDTVATFWPGMTFPQQNSLLRNDGAGRFDDLSARSGRGLLQRRASRGVASADFDHDGDVDLLVAQQDSAASLLRNDLGPGAHWIQLRLRGRSPNRDGIGARVELWAGGRRQVRTVSAGGGYQSSSEPVLHFGLGATSRVERVSVEWPPPRRRRSVHEGLAVDRRVELSEPD